MERYSFQKIEDKWRKNKEANSVKNLKSKKYYCQKCFHIHLVKFIWAMFAIIP